VHRLREQIADFDIRITEKVKLAEEQLVQNVQELESHKSKRLAARSEMIGMAQAYERAEAELLETQEFLRYTLIPLVFEQISGVESALQHIEFATGIILSKKAMRFRAKASNFLNRQTDPSTTDSSTSKLTNSSADLDDEKEPSNIHKAKFRGSKISECMEQAYVLKNELDRVQSGVKLLGDSVERLSTAVQSDSRCCAGLCDAIWMSVTSYLWPYGEKGLSQGKYESVRLDESIHNEDHPIERFVGDDDL